MEEVEKRIVLGTGSFQDSFCKIRDPQNSPLERNGFALGIGSFCWNFGGFSSFREKKEPADSISPILTRVCFSTGRKLVNQYNQISFRFFFNAHQLGSDQNPGSLLLANGYFQIPEDLCPKWCFGKCISVTNMANILGISVKFSGV